MIGPITCINNGNMQQTMHTDLLTRRAPISAKAMSYFVHECAMCVYICGMCDAIHTGYNVMCV
jgi:hypothetical protein